MSYILCVISFIVCTLILLICVDVLTKPVGPSPIERFFCLIAIFTTGSLMYLLAKALIS